MSGLADADTLECARTMSSILQRAERNRDQKSKLDAVHKKYAHEKYLCVSVKFSRGVTE